MTAFLLIAVALVPVVYSLWQGYSAYRIVKNPSEFLLDPKGFAASKLRDSITASNLSLGSAVFAFLSFGYDFRVAAIVSPITWLAGYFVLLRFYPKISSSLNGMTLHGFLANRYDSATLGYLASIASIVGFLGTYGVEVLVAIKLFSALPANPVSGLLLAMIVALIVTAYTALGGFRAASHADTFRLRGTIVAIFAVFGFMLFAAFSSPVALQQKAKAELLAQHCGFGNLTLLFVASLLVLNVPWQLVDMSVWQRLSACSSAADVKKGIQKSILWTGIFWLLLISIGAMMHYIPEFASPENGDYATPFLKFLTNNIVLALFVSGCLAALMSTADSLLIASVQTLVMDVFFRTKPPERVFKETGDDAEKKEGEDILKVCRKWVFIFGLASPIFIYLVNLLVPGILDLFFLIYTAQLALLVSVVVALLAPNRAARCKTTAILSVVFGLCAAASMFVTMLLHPSMNIFLLAPIVSVGASLIPWGASLFLKGRKAP